MVKLIEYLEITLFNEIEMPFMMQMHSSRMIFKEIKRHFTKDQLLEETKNLLTSRKYN